MNGPEAASCSCASLPHLAAVTMGGDGLDERVLATFRSVRDHGGDLWWLYLSRCSACGQHWMVAQEERIFDQYFLRRVGEAEAQATGEGRWPDDFITYERVLEIGHRLATPCRFLNPLASSLIWSAHDLRRERPAISVEEIARLLGVTPGNAARLLEAKDG
jgi:hypothetical protein